MKRMLLIGAMLLPGLSCQAPGDRVGALPPLPDKVTPLPYAQLLQRARDQGERAVRAFYVENWVDLEDTARGLEQTALYLSKAEDVPAKHKDTLVTVSGDLGKLAKSLLDAAAAKDVKKINEVILPKLISKVREMRLAD